MATADIPKERLSDRGTEKLPPGLLRGIGRGRNVNRLEDARKEELTRRSLRFDLNEGRPQEAWSGLMAAPPEWRGDWTTVSLLVECAARMDDRKRARHILYEYQTVI